jgi:hypothetical protein
MKVPPYTGFLVVGVVGVVEVVVLVDEDVVLVVVVVEEVVAVVEVSLPQPVKNKLARRIIVSVIKIIFFI